VLNYILLIHLYWRAFYRRMGDAFVIGAVGPEAKTDPRGFERALQNAAMRLNETESEGGMK